jgi:hypothetical protein
VLEERAAAGCTAISSTRAKRKEEKSLIGFISSLFYQALAARNS